jgi:hypothetical protein
MNANKGLEELNFVRLECALLCVNCELIVSETRSGKCPVCGSGALLDLARMLGAVDATDKFCRYEAPPGHPARATFED